MFLLLLTIIAWPCLQHSRNLGPTFQPSLVFCQIMLPNRTYHEVQCGSVRRFALSSPKRLPPSLVHCSLLPLSRSLSRPLSLLSEPFQIQLSSLFPWGIFHLQCRPRPEFRVSPCLRCHIDTFWTVSRSPSSLQVRSTSTAHY